LTYVKQTHCAVALAGAVTRKLGFTLSLIPIPQERLMKKSRLVAAGVAVAALTAWAAQAQTQTQEVDHAAHHTPAAATAPQAAEFVQGEVRRVHTDTGKVTLRHGPIPNLDMPEMTMVFQVQDPSALESLKPGDKVRFTADKVGETFVVTALELAR
jgi:Cu(I)/Ag(I) efflux system periplasmic protein CusF